MRCAQRGLQRGAAAKHIQASPQMQERTGSDRAPPRLSQLVPSGPLGVADEPLAFAALPTSSKLVFAAPFSYIS